MVKLDRLINVLGNHGARLLGPAATRDTELHSVALHDPSDLGRVVGDVFLAVGVPALPRAVELAAAAEAVVVLVRGEAERADGVIASRYGDIVVVLIDPAVTWSQVAEVVYGLVFEGRETESGRGPTDLSTLADTVAAAVGGPVTIEDQMSRVVAYSSAQEDADPARLDTILGRRVPEAVRELFDQLGVFTHLAHSDEPLFVPPSPEHGLGGRMVVAVRAGRELLGSVWVRCDAPLPPLRAQMLTHTARTVALHLLRSRVSADLERQVESELVIQLLQGTPDVPALIGRLGLPPGQFRVIALQAHVRGAQHAAILLAFEHATTGFGWSRPGRSTLFGNTVYTLLPCGDDAGPAQRWLRGLVQGLPANVTVTAGIGGVAETSQLPAARHEADESLALHATRPTSAPITYDESWDQILLQRLRTAATAGRAPVPGPIQDLARHDAAHATQFLPTLRAWLLAHGDLGTASALLGVHPNTVRNRIRKMTKIANNLDLDDPKLRLAMHIALAVEGDLP